MIDREELAYIRETLGIDRLIKDILELSSRVSKTYNDEYLVRKAIRKAEYDVEGIKLELETAANEEGKNDRERKSLYLQKCREHPAVRQAEETIRKLQDELEGLRAQRQQAEVELNARRSVCYLIGQVLAACHAQAVYDMAGYEGEEGETPQTPESPITEEEVPF